MDITSFILHKDSLCILDKLDDQQAGRFIKAIYYYQMNGKLPSEMDFVVELAVTPFVNQFIRDIENYKSVVEKRKQAGSKGGKQRVANQASASSAQASEANQADSDTKNGSKSKNDSDSKKDKNDLASNKYPTIDEVVSFFTERGYKQEIARKAFYHYDAAKWKIKGIPIYNWEQVMVSWFKDEYRETEKRKPHFVDDCPVLPAHNPSEWNPYE